MQVGIVSWGAALCGQKYESPCERAVPPPLWQPRRMPSPARPHHALPPALRPLHLACFHARFAPPAAIYTDIGMVRPWLDAALAQMTGKPMTARGAWRRCLGQAYGKRRGDGPLDLCYLRASVCGQDANA